MDKMTILYQDILIIGTPISMIIIYVEHNFATKLRQSKQIEEKENDEK